MQIQLSGILYRDRGRSETFDGVYDYSPTDGDIDIIRDLQTILNKTIDGYSPMTLESINEKSNEDFVGIIPDNPSDYEQTNDLVEVRYFKILSEPESATIRINNLGYCRNLSYISFPYGEEFKIEIGDGVFQYNKNLEYIDLSKSISYIGKKAFYGCGKLNYVKLNKNTNFAQTIDEEAFAECSALRTVNFKNCSIAKICSKAFQYSALDYVDFTGCKARTSGLAYNTELEDEAFNGCALITYIKIPENIDVVEGNIPFSGLPYTKYFKNKSGHKIFDGNILNSLEYFGSEELKSVDFERDYKSGFNEYPYLDIATERTTYCNIDSIPAKFSDGSSPILRLDLGTTKANEREELKFKYIKIPNKKYLKFESFDFIAQYEEIAEGDEEITIKQYNFYNIQVDMTKYDYVPTLDISYFDNEELYSMINIHAQIIVKPSMKKAFQQATNWCMMNIKTWADGVDDVVAQEGLPGEQE